MRFPFSHNTDFFLWKTDNQNVSLITEKGGAENAQAKSRITLPAGAQDGRDPQRGHPDLPQREEASEGPFWCSH